MGAAAIAVIGAQVAISAAQGYQEVQASKSQAEVSEASIELDSAQTEFDIRATAASQSEQFRRDLASQLTLATYRGGAGMARQFASQSFSAYGQDMLALDRASQTNAIRTLNQKAQAQATKAAGYTNAFTGGLQSIIGTAGMMTGGGK